MPHLVPSQTCSNDGDEGFGLMPRERACATITRILYQVTQRQRAEKRARAEAEAIAVEPKFVRVQRTVR